MPVYITSNWNAVDRELDRLDRIPLGSSTKRTLDAVLTTGFEQSQERVHVITGALKASGKQSSKIEGKSWEGEIVYGGPSAPRDADYAIYELARGGDHNWMGNIHLLHSLYVEGVKEILEP